MDTENELKDGYVQQYMLYKALRQNVEDAIKINYGQSATIGFTSKLYRSPKKAWRVSLLYRGRNRLFYQCSCDKLSHFFISIFFCGCFKIFFPSFLRVIMHRSIIVFSASPPWDDFILVLFFIFIIITWTIIFCLNLLI